MNIARTITETRLDILLLVAPFLLISEAAGVPGGTILALAIIAALLTTLALLDRTTISNARGIRLSLLPPNASQCDAAPKLVMPIAAVLTLVLAAVLFVSVSAFAAITLALLVAGAALIATGVTPEYGKPTLVTLPTATLVLHLFIANSLGDESISMLVLASMMGACALGVFIALCQRRDEHLDITEGTATAVTTLGRQGIFAVIFPLLALAVIAASAGSANGWWHWGVPSALAIGGFASVWAMGQDADEHAVTAWWTGAAFAAVVLWATFSSTPSA